MQLTLKKYPAEIQMQLLEPLVGEPLLIVVQCGSFQIMHFGIVNQIDTTRKTLTVGCRLEKYRNEYTGKNFTQHERQRTPNGKLIRESDQWQTIPIELIARIVDNS